MSDLKVRPADTSEWRSAFEILYSHLGAKDRAAHIEQSMDLAEKGAVNLVGLHVACEGHRTIGAMLMIASPGRTMLIWPPRADPSLSVELKHQVHLALAQAVEGFGTEKMVRMAQCLLSDEDSAISEIFKEAGFNRLTRLMQLYRNTDPEPPADPLIDLYFDEYSSQNHDRFRKVLAQSYEASLDCPELTGLRAMDEIIESHQSQGQFFAENWLLAMHGGKDVGCLLMASLPELNAIEIAYVATVPGARGKHIGRELTRKAIRMAKNQRCSFVTLAVDCRNTPARDLYASEGFEVWDEREVFLRVLDPLDGKFDRGIAVP